MSRSGSSDSHQSARSPPVRPAYPRPEERDVHQGRILWLPPLENIVPNPEPGNRAPVVELRGSGSGWRSVRSRIFDHPIVILSRSIETPDLVDFALMTSFHGREITEHFTWMSSRQRRSQQDLHIPVTPARPHPRDRDAYRVLILHGGLEMGRPGYVNAKGVYRMPWSTAEEYFVGSSTQRQDWRFDGESMERILALVNVKNAWYSPGLQTVASTGRRSVTSVASPRQTPQTTHGSDTRAGAFVAVRPGPQSSGPRTPAFVNASDHWTIDPERRLLLPDKPREPQYGERPIVTIGKLFWKVTLSCWSFFRTLLKRVLAVLLWAKGSSGSWTGQT